TLAAARPDLVLDLGAGTGALSEALLLHGGAGAVELIDVDAEMLDQARLRLARFGARGVRLFCVECYLIHS
ncbi:MAG: methyltransferase domain-containing protein, partial [Deltaproteobacteria bacterium]|nr:methyltransferase domain-containing protein [Deltaproteobacteria bacterium]